MQLPWLLLISGPPCSGKSALAARVSRDTGWPIVAKDTYKEILFEVLGAGDPAWSRRLSRAAFAIQFGVADSLLSAGASLLLEGNFNAGEHAEQIASMVAGRARVLQLACSAEDALLAARWRARARLGLRHPGHLDSGNERVARDTERYAPLPGLPTLCHDSGAPAESGYAALLRGLAAAGVAVEPPPDRG